MSIAAATRTRDSKVFANVSGHFPSFQHSENAHATSFGNDGAGLF